MRTRVRHARAAVALVSLLVFGAMPARQAASGPSVGAAAKRAGVSPAVEAAEPAATEKAAEPAVEPTAETAAAPARLFALVGEVEPDRPAGDLAATVAGARPDAAATSPVAEIALALADLRVETHDRADAGARGDEARPAADEAAARKPAPEKPEVENPEAGKPKPAKPAAAKPKPARKPPAPAPPPELVLPDPTGSASGALAAPWCSNGEQIIVDASLGAPVQALLNEAARWGVDLCARSGFRTYAEQVELRRANCGGSEHAILHAAPSSCSPPTARPGTSNHEDGLAIDFSCGDGQPMTHASPCYRWLAAHAGFYGLRNLPSEPWHWSVSGR